MRNALTRAIRALADTLFVPASGTTGLNPHRRAVVPDMTAGMNASTSAASRRSSRTQNSSVTLESLEGRTLMSTYYVSPYGSDNNNGLSQSSPWKSIGKVDSVSFHPGDNVLFQGGQTFNGTLYIGSSRAGSSSNPVTYGSYNGQATISSGGATGAYVENASGVWFENLKFVGSPSGAPQSGIDLEGYTGGVYYVNDRVQNCDISGYWTAGILVEGSHSNGGFNGLQVTGCALHNNIEAGLFTCGPSPTTIENLYVAYNQTYDNTGWGNGSGYISGNGIELSAVNGAMVEYNTAYDNSSKGGDGGVGIWAFSSNDVTLQYNASYDNVSLGRNDGDGFDFDADVSNSLIQYNYAYGNDGTGIQLDQWHDNSIFTNDIVRYNVLVDNARKNNYGNLEVWGKVLNSYLYNNTIYTTPGNSGSSSAIRVHNSTIPGLYVSNVHFVNNIVETTGGAALINIPQSEAQGAQNLTFTGNLYWTNGYTPTFIDGKSTAHSLASWQSIGQEKSGGHLYGAFANPDFKGANGGVAVASASPGTLSNAAAGYQIQSGSPALWAQINIELMYGIGTGGRDFYGDTFSNSATTIAGADQL